MKKFATVMLTLVLILSTMSMVASAQTIETHGGTELNSGDFDFTQPRYIPCPGGGRHFMRPVGMCVVRGSILSSPVVFSGTTTQCSNCDMYMAVQHYPGVNRPFIGRFNKSSPVAGLDGVSTFLGGSHGEYWELHEDSFIDGFEWAGYV